MIRRIISENQFKKLFAYRAFKGIYRPCAFLSIDSGADINSKENQSNIIDGVFLKKQTCIIPQQVDYLDLFQLIGIKNSQLKFLIMLNELQKHQNALQNLFEGIIQFESVQFSSLILLWKKIKLYEIMCLKFQCYSLTQTNKKLAKLLQEFCQSLKNQLSKIQSIMDSSLTQLQEQTFRNLQWLIDNNLNFYDLLEATQTLILPLTSFNPMNTDQQQNNKQQQEEFKFANRIKLIYAQIFILINCLRTHKKRQKLMQKFKKMLQQNKNKLLNAELYIRIFQMEAYHLLNLFPNLIFPAKQVKLIEYCMAEGRVYERMLNLLSEKQKPNQIIVTAEACMVFLYRTALIHNNSIVLKAIFKKLAAITKNLNFYLDLDLKLSLCNILYLSRKSSQQHFSGICGKFYKQIQAKLLCDDGGALKNIFGSINQSKYIIQAIEKKVDDTFIQINQKKLIKYIKNFRSALQIKYGVKIFRAFAVLLQEQQNKNRPAIWKLFQSNQIVINVLNNNIAIADLVFEVPKMYEFYGRQFPNSFKNVQKKMKNYQEYLKKMNDNLHPINMKAVVKEAKGFLSIGNHEQMIGSQKLSNRWWIFQRSFSFCQFPSYLINNPDLSRLSIFRFINLFVDSCLRRNSQFVNSNVWQFPHYYDFVLSKSGQKQKNIYLSFTSKIHGSGIFSIKRNDQIFLNYSDYLSILQKNDEKNIQIPPKNQND